MRDCWYIGMIVFLAATEPQEIMVSPAVWSFWYRLNVLEISEGVVLLPVCFLKAQGRGSMSNRGDQRTPRPSERACNHLHDQPDTANKSITLSPHDSTGEIKQSNSIPNMPSCVWRWWSSWWGYTVSNLHSMEETEPDTNNCVLQRVPNTCWDSLSLVIWLVQALKCIPGTPLTGGGARRVEEPTLATTWPPLFSILEKKNIRKNGRFLFLICVHRPCASAIIHFTNATSIFECALSHGVIVINWFWYVVIEYYSLKWGLRKPQEFT